MRVAPRPPERSAHHQHTVVLTFPLPKALQQLLQDVVVNDFGDPIVRSDEGIEISGGAVQQFPGRNRLNRGRTHHIENGGIFTEPVAGLEMVQDDFRNPLLAFALDFFGQKDLEFTIRDDI